MSLNYLIVVLLVGLGLYCLLTKRNLIKMIIGLSIITDGAHLLLISLGYRAEGIAPIIPQRMMEEFAVIAEIGVDPLPQALVLTSIVINVCILALAITLIILNFRHKGTLDPFELTDLKK